MMPMRSPTFTPSLGPVKIERGESSACQLPEPRDFARCSDDHDLNRLRLGDALQLPRGHWRLIKDHRVRWGVPDIATRHGHRLIVLVVTKSSYDASCLCGRGLVASYDHSRGRIEIIQESPQGAGSGAAGDGDVLDDRHLVIGGNFWRLHIRNSHASTTVRTVSSLRTDERTSARSSAAVPATARTGRVLKIRPARAALVMGTTSIPVGPDSRRPASEIASAVSASRVTTTTWVPPADGSMRARAGVRNSAIDSVVCGSV